MFWRDSIRGWNFWLLFIYIRIYGIIISNSLNRTRKGRFDVDVCPGVLKALEPDPSQCYRGPGTASEGHVCKAGRGRGRRNETGPCTPVRASVFRFIDTCRQKKTIVRRVGKSVTKIDRTRRKKRLQSRWNVLCAGLHRRLNEPWRNFRSECRREKRNDLSLKIQHNTGSSENRCLWTLSLVFGNMKTTTSDVSTRTGGRLYWKSLLHIRYYILVIERLESDCSSKKKNK